MQFPSNLNSSNTFQPESGQWVEELVMNLQNLTLDALLPLPVARTPTSNENAPAILPCIFEDPFDSKLVEQEITINPPTLQGLSDAVSSLHLRKFSEFATPSTKLHIISATRINLPDI